MDLLAPDPTTRAQFSVRRIVIRRLKGIVSLDLPLAVPAWRDALPGAVTLGGEDARSKVALFEAIFRALEVLRKRSTSLAPELGNGDTQIRIDFEQVLANHPPRRVRYIQGDDAFIAKHGSADSYGFRRHAGRFHPFITGTADGLSRQLHGWLPGLLPSLIYFPSAARDADLADDPSDVHSHRRDRATFAHRWRPPRDWTEPVDYLATTLTDDDFGERAPRRAIRKTFDAYAEELDAFTGGLRNLTWRNGALTIDANGVELPMSSLSRAERRAMVLAAELNRRWYPGSLVLIDEPDLELHPAWQTLLLQRIQALHRERGGQVWIATRSAHLYGLTDATTRGILPVQQRPKLAEPQSAGNSRAAPPMWRGTQT